MKYYNKLNLVKREKAKYLVILIVLYKILIKKNSNTYLNFKKWSIESNKTLNN